MTSHNNISRVRLGSIIRQAVQSNIEALIDFAERCLNHRGHYLADRLWQVQRTSNGTVALGLGLSGPSLGLCLGMGGEIVNSFVTLYELAYFFECAFLAAVATCVHESHSVQPSDGWDKRCLRKVLLEPDEETWEFYLSQPKAAIISSLDADIIPVRYGKHQLWGVPPELERARCQNISTSELMGPPSIHPLDDIYWIDEDKEIAARALASAETMNHAKAVQYFLGLEPFARDLGIDLYKYPLLFNFVPKSELLSLGPSNLFFDSLDEIHSVYERLKLRAITGRTDPWALSFSCPKCGQASKRVIQTMLRPDGRTIQIRCNPKNHIYQNEFGNQFIQRGCGARTTKALDRGAKAVYDFVAANDITLYYPVKQILAILRTSHDTPVALPATDIGVIAVGGMYERDPSTPRGFGDHLDMLTSCMAVQKAYLEGLICPVSSGRARSEGALVANTTMLLAYQGRSALIDPSVRVHTDGRPVTDTSARKSRRTGADTLGMFRAAINMTHFDLDTLLRLRTIKQRTWADIVERLERWCSR